MRILTLSNVPLEARLGSGYVTLGYADGLRARGHKVDVVGPETLELFKFLRRGKLQRLAWGMWLHAARQAAQGQYDVVEFYGGQNCHAARLLHRGRNNGRRFLTVAHSNGIEMHAGEEMAKGGIIDTPKMWTWLHRLVELPVERTFTDVDGIVTVSEFDRKYASQHSLQPDRRLKAIENPLQDDFIGLEFPVERAPLIGFVAPWYPRKGTLLLEQAIPTILRRFDKARVRLIAVGSHFFKEEHFPADVCARIEVIKEGASREALKRHYMEMATLVMPSPYESFGLVASESMACGSALVAHRTGFADSLIDGKEAYLLEKPDGASLIEALSRMLSDDALRRRIAANGWKRVQSLRWGPAIEELESTYLRWLEEIRSGVDGGNAGR